MAEKGKVPVYQIAIDESELSATGVHCISNVLDPAIESNFIALSKTPPNILQVNKANMAKVALGESKPMKGLITGPILIPNFKILRMDADRNPYYIEFSEEVIEKIRDKYSKQGWHRNNNDDHATPLGGTSIVELWIVEDPEKDKSAALGLTVPKGTLMATMKVEDHEYFQSEILSGNRKGFSIEGWFNYDGPEAMSAKQQKQKSKLNMSTKPKKAKGGVMSALAALFGALSGHTEHLATHVMEDGTNLIVVDETQQVYYHTEDNELGDALPDGEYLLTDGTTLVVMEGKVFEIREAEASTDDDPAEEAVVSEEVASIAAATGVDAATLMAALTEAKLSIVDVTKPVELSVKHQLTAEEKLSVVVDSEGLVLFVDQTNGSVWKVGEDLWYEGPATPGEYMLADGTTLTVFERVEEFENWDGTKMTVTKSFVNYTASTVAVETLVPWLKETMSAVVQATEALTAKNAEIATLKAKLGKQPASPAPIKAPTITKPTAPVVMSARDKRIEQGSAAIAKLHKAAGN